MVAEDDMDLRHFTVWERASRVLERADELPTNASFAFLTEVNPRALLSRLEQLRPGWFAFRPHRVGDDVWQITVTRVAADDNAGLRASFARNPLLSKLSERGRHLIETAVTETDLRKGDQIVSENEPRTWLGVVLSGAVGIFAGAGSRERLLFHLYPYDLFGEVELLDEGLSMGSARVLSRTARIARIPYDTLRDLLPTEVPFLRELATLTAQHTRSLAGVLAEQAHHPILSRVAIALLPYAAPERGLHPALPPLPTMTQSQLAAAAGTVKEVAARAIAELERMGALQRERGHIAFLDRVKLLATIDPN